MHNLDCGLKARVVLPYSLSLAQWVSICVVPKPATYSLALFIRVY